MADAGDTALHGLQDGPETFWMILMQVLGHLGQVVAASGQVLGKAFFRRGACVGNVEIRDLPVLDQAAELGHDPELLELA